MLELTHEEVNGVSKWTEKDLQDIVTLLSHMYADGLGSKDVKSVIRDVAVGNPNLAKEIHEELSYWRKHEENSKT